MVIKDPRQETVLEMARRHVRQGEARLARQQQLVREMELRDEAQMIEVGQVLLHIMETVVAQARRHVRQLENPTEHVLSVYMDEIETGEHGT